MEFHAPEMDSELEYIGETCFANSDVKNKILRLFPTHPDDITTRYNLCFIVHQFLSMEQFIAEHNYAG